MNSIVEIRNRILLLGANTFMPRMSGI